VQRTTAFMSHEVSNERGGPRLIIEILGGDATADVDCMNIFDTLCVEYGLQNNQLWRNFVKDPPNPHLLRSKRRWPNFGGRR
jgi:hypothetical protein